LKHAKAILREGSFFRYLRVVDWLCGAAGKVTGAARFQAR